MNNKKYKKAGASALLNSSSSSSFNPRINSRTSFNPINKKQITQPNISEQYEEYEELKDQIIEHEYKIFDHDIHLKPITIDKLFNKNNYTTVEKKNLKKIIKNYLII
jgi:hypothetical protein